MPVLAHLALLVLLVSCANCASPSLQQRYMDELTLMDVPEPTQFAKSSALILEQVSAFVVAHAAACEHAG